MYQPTMYVVACIHPEFYLDVDENGDLFHTPRMFEASDRCDKYNKHMTGMKFQIMMLTSDFYR